MLFVLMLMFVLIFGGSKWLKALFSCTTRVYFIRWLAVPGGKRRYRPAPVWSTIVRLFCLDNCWLLTHDSMRVECVYIRWRPDLACKPVVITKCFIWFYNSSSLSFLFPFRLVFFWTDCQQIIHFWICQLIPWSEIFVNITNMSISIESFAFVELLQWLIIIQWIMPTFVRFN